MQNGNRNLTLLQSLLSHSSFSGFLVESGIIRIEVMGPYKNQFSKAKRHFQCGPL